MTTTTTTTSTAVESTTPAEVRRRLRLPVRLALVVIVVGVIAALVRGGAPDHDLDPASPSKTGTRALATLLADHGSPVTRLPEPSRATATDVGIVVARPDLLPDRDIDEVLALAEDHDVVVMVPSIDAAEALGVDAQDRGTNDATDPGCSLPAATAAGSVSRLALGIVGTPAGFSRAQRCYRGAVVVFHPVSGSGTLTIVGGTRWVTDQHLGEHGNAALAINLMAGHARTDWVLPLPGEITLGSGDGEHSFFDVVPSGIIGAAWQLVLATLLLALAVSRRLGPVVAERLPVAVKGTETSRGRARLWAGAKAHDRAALALREHTRGRLAVALGLGPSTPPDALVDAVAERSGRLTEVVRSLLFGAAPPSDAALVALADDLADLITTITTQGAP